MTDEDNMPRVIAAYRKLRDLKDAKKKQHSEELRPLNDKIIELEAWMLNKLNEVGANSIKTESGTAYKSTQTKAKVSDWDEALTFVRTNDLWHLLERRVSKTAVEEYIESEGTPPPGIEVDSEVKLNVRKPS